MEGLMERRIYPTKKELGEAAASHGAEEINRAIEQKGHAHIILATGASQFEMLEALVKKDVDWSRVSAFHLDEYIGLSMEHPASFRKYLKERFIDKITGIKEFHFVNGEKENPEGECVRLGKLIKNVVIDVAFIGIGENGHIAFNDPPADFETSEPYLVVELDEACRKQQLNEGWFKTFEDVPQKAISMSVSQVMKSAHVVVTIPDARKAKAVQCAVEGEVSPLCPASILQKHEHCVLFLDRESSSALEDAQ